MTPAARRTLGRLARAAAAVAIAVGVVLWFAPRPHAKPAPAAPEPGPEISETEISEPRQIRVARIELPEPPAPSKPEPPPDPEPQTKPRIEAEREPARTPAPAPAPAAQPAAPASPAAARPSLVSVSRGEALLRAGVFPRMRATYDRIGFEAYRDAVAALGGRFFLYDPLARRPLAEIDPRSGIARAGDTAELRPGLSRWPRDVTRHLSGALRRGQAQHAGASRVILLPPERIDAALLGALDGALARSDLDATDLTRVDVAYELRGGRLLCEVLSVGLRDGSEHALALRVDLSGGIGS